MTDQNQLLSDALQKGLEYARLALSEHETKYGRHPVVEADRKVIVDDVTELEEALDHLAEGQELVSLCGRVKISGPREDVEHIVRLLPDVDDQSAESGEVADYKALYEDAMRASNEAGFVGLDAAATIRALSELTTSPASQEQSAYEPAGFLLHWPGSGGGRDILWSKDGAEGQAIGCPVTEVFKRMPASQEPYAQTWFAVLGTLDEVHGRQWRTRCETLHESLIATLKTGRQQTLSVSTTEFRQWLKMFDESTARTMSTLEKGDPSGPSSLNWQWYLIKGDRRSINEVQRALYESQKVPRLMRYIDELEMSCKSHEIVKAKPVKPNLVESKDPFSVIASPNQNNSGHLVYEDGSPGPIATSGEGSPDLSGFDALLKFYNVRNLEELVDAQEKHVQKLQSRLVGSLFEPALPTRPRKA